MSIGILLTLDNAEFDGVTRFNPATATWTLEANNQFRADVPASQDVGIIDPRDLLTFLTGLFGPFLEHTSYEVGSSNKITDLVAERSFLFVGGGTTNEWGVHSQGGSGGPSGRRLRQGPAYFPTETAGVFQAGGSGQVSHTDLADGQAGVMTVPTGQRIYVLSDAATGDHQFGLWLFPVYASRDIGKLVQAGQPPAQFA